MRILIVDDDVTNRRLLKVMLQTGGVSVIEAATASDALTLLDGAGDVTAVLMDLRMPGMDGLAAVRRIRDRDDDRAQLPIAIVTADTAVDLAEQCEAAGADTLIRKPLNMGSLHDAVGRLLAQRAPEGLMLN